MFAFLIILFILTVILVYATVGVLYGVKIHRRYKAKCPHLGTSKCDTDCTHFWAGVINGVFWPFSWCLQLPILLVYKLNESPVISAKEKELAGLVTKVELQRKILANEKELEKYGYISRDNFHR